MAAAAATWLFEWAGLGDDLDAVAVCRARPGPLPHERCPAPAQVRTPGARSPGDGPYATMDALCRDGDGRALGVRRLDLRRSRAMRPGWP